MTQSSVDLATIFQTVTQALAENQQSLNQADEYNRDHGDNMVQTFQTITNALEQKKGSSASTALNYAARQVSKTAGSSSGQLYAQNLAQAATQFKGKKVDAQGAVQLLQLLIGGGQAAQGQAPQPAGGDMLGTLLGGLAGGQAAQGQQSPAVGDDMLGALLGGLTGGQQAPANPAPRPSSPQSGDDMLGALLGGLTGGSSTGASSSGGGLQDGLGLDDLLNAGMAYFAAKQSGGSNTQALVQALLAGSGMGNSVHRNESTQIVINAFLQALGSINRRQ